MGLFQVPRFRDFGVIALRIRKIGYQGEKHRREPHRSTSHKTLRTMKPRLRQIERAGLGIGVLLAGNNIVWKCVCLWTLDACMVKMAASHLMSF